MTAIEMQEIKMSESAGNSDSDALRATLDELRLQVGSLAERVAGLEKLAPPAAPQAAPVAQGSVAETRVSAVPPTTSSVAAEAGISEEELLAISAAIATWLGVHAHIRQVRLIRTGAWAQQGRVTIQASHRLNY